MSQLYANISSNYYVDNSKKGSSRNGKVIIKEEIDVHPIEIEVYNEEIESTEVNEYQNVKKTKEQSDTKQEKLSKTCSYCGKMLASTSSLYVHLKSHSSNKPYICNECGANFTRKYYLEVHLRTHTGERPFKCDICEKYFSQKSSLNTHKRQHTGETPYQCSMCDKAFSAKSYLTSHQWVHYQKNDGLFTCLCDSSLKFSSRTDFIKHVRTHINNLVYKCDLCSKSFSKEAYLIRHRNGVHRRSNQNG